MDNNLIELNFLSIFALLTFFIFLIVKNFSYKLKNGILLDKDFSKPQAFHKEPISRCGGLAVLFRCYYFLLFTISYFQK